jgi:drug/metabolite transporter (DMT)-like permease
VGFWLQGSYVVPKVGSLVTVWSYYVLGTVLLGGLALSRASLVRPSNARDVILAIGTGLLAVAAYLALAIGQHMGSVAVVTMLSSLASAFAVIFAALILKERIAASGWIGLGGIIGGLMLLHV